MQPHDTTEQWRDVPGYEGLYQVSDAGNVRRLAQRITTKRGHTQTHNAKTKSLGIKSGYYYLWLFKNNEGRKYYVHELVAIAFIGPRPDRHQVHHKNENRFDNRPSNLEYLEWGEHSAHHFRGEKSSSSKINEEQAKRIRDLYETMPVHAIAKQMRLPYHLVWGVAHNRTWNHVT